MSTYSPNLGIELITPGTQRGTWGITLNENLGTLIEQAIAGYVTQAVSTGTDTTITIPDGATGVARNMYIELTGTGGTNTNLIVPAKTKLYFIYNNSSGAVTVKVSGQTGVNVPAAAKVALVCDGTDIISALNYVSGFNTDSLTVGKLVATQDSEFTSTGALLISKGTGIQQPGTPVTGMLRYNTTTNEFEGYSGSSPSWKSVGGSAISNDTSTASDLYPSFLGATSGTAQNIYTSNAKLLYKPSTGEFKASVPVAANGIVVNATTMTESYTLATGFNGITVGPFTIASGASLTITSGQRHIIL